ncbi:MAG: FGGY-family carbohydrate kinase [Candidatus Thiodiazotropha sp. (ex Myrtea spinifera)]|nr:FGGY-family carbohydrate kinase [Candidatus Thiodiazotropha sp. (ex Myrtea spinifera)]
MSGAASIPPWSSSTGPRIGYHPLPSSSPEPLKCYIGIDLGTSGCRGIAIGDQARVIAESSIALPLPESPHPGYSQQDPRLWWDAVIRILQVLGQACKGNTLEAIAVDGTSSTLLLSDDRGTPLTDGLMYNDSRGHDTLSRLRMLAPPGSPVLSASSSLAKLLHLCKTVSTRPIHALHQADWIMGKLCNRFPLSDENNCLKLGYDPINRHWPSWMKALDLPEESLPKVYPSATAVGTLSKAVAAETGFPTTTKVVTGTTDSNAAFLATGASEIGDAVTSLGSTLVLKILSDTPVFASEYGVYSHRMGDLWLVGGASNSGGAVCRAFFTDEQMIELSARLEPTQPTGLEYYPLLTPGERFPVNDREFPPKLTPRPESDVSFFQGILEGLTQIERDGYRLLHRLGAPKPQRILSIGGGAANEPWRIMRESVIGIPITRAAQQAAAYGVALLARQGGKN